MKPAIVLIYGRSAVGKTTLARRLSQDLQIESLSLDTIKESLYDEGFHETADSDIKDAQFWAIDNAAFAGQLAVARSWLKGGRPLIFELHINKNQINEVVAMAKDLSVQLVSISLIMKDDNVRLRRHNLRLENGERDPRHRDVLKKPNSSEGKSDHSAYRTDIQPDFILSMDDFSDDDYKKVLEQLKSATRQ